MAGVGERGKKHFEVSTLLLIILEIKLKGAGLVHWEDRRMQCNNKAEFGNVTFWTRVP